MVNGSDGFNMFNVLILGRFMSNIRVVTQIGMSTMYVTFINITSINVFFEIFLHFMLFTIFVWHSVYPVYKMYSLCVYP